jgi:serpin B
MNTTLALLSFLCIMFTATFSAASETNEKPRKDFSAANSAFAVDLYRNLAVTGKNLFFSPYSIETAISMTMSGAKNRTERQMGEVLHVAPEAMTQHQAGIASFEKQLASVQKQGKVTIASSNSIWPQMGYPLSPSWLALLKRHYGTSVTPVDYIRETEKARLAINRRVEKDTKNRISELLKPGILDPLTRLALVNAVYFKGDWEHPFDKKNTTAYPFHIREGKTADAQLMRQSASFGYADHDSVQVLELPYAGEELSMIVVLPKERFGLESIERTLTAEEFGKWTGNLVRRKIEAFLPKFRTTSSFRLDKTMQQLGMTDAFDRNLADFSAMVTNRDRLYIGAVVHKAFVDVSEEGTEAAAATAVVMQLKSMMPVPVPIFRADHPFLFAIRENGSGRLLFMGRVCDPTSGGE